MHCPECKMRLQGVSKLPTLYLLNCPDHGLFVLLPDGTLTPLSKHKDANKALAKSH